MDFLQGRKSLKLGSEIVHAWRGIKKHNSTPCTEGDYFLDMKIFWQSIDDKNSYRAKLFINKPNMFKVKINKS